MVSLISVSVEVILIGTLEASTVAKLKHHQIGIDIMLKHNQDKKIREIKRLLKIFDEIGLTILNNH